MTQPQCNEWVHWLPDILVKTLKTLGELPDRNHLRVQYIPHNVRMYYLMEQKDQ